MTRYLGVDYGTKRIGLAISDAGGTIASPLVTVEARGAVADHVNAVLAETDDYAFDEIVVGLPLNMDGTEGEQARKTRGFGDALGAASGKPVRYFDERLSSLEAEEKLREADLGRGKKKARVDALAAQITLQEFLDTLQ
ncbi:MAG: Holliday junction resolvase RuvX [Phycisphaerales bacterium]|nr:MAG: Holliday junction resolvase RuvX [Phycisphaerales bacterium]